MNGPHELSLRRGIAQGVPQRLDRTGYRPVTDRAPLPDRLDKIVAADDAVPVTDQKPKEQEALGFNRDRLVILQQLRRCFVEHERTKAPDLSRFTAQIRILQQSSKDRPVPLKHHGSVAVN